MGKPDLVSRPAQIKSKRPAALPGLALRRGGGLRSCRDQCRPVPTAAGSAQASWLCAGSHATGRKRGAVARLVAFPSRRSIDDNWR